MLHCSIMEVLSDLMSKLFSGQAIWLIVKRRAQLAGLVGDFGAHSLRSGFVTEAGRQNVPLGEGMALTGHRSVSMFLRYFQPGALQLSAAANLMKDSTEADEP
jgi:integrase